VTRRPAHSLAARASPPLNKETAMKTPSKKSSRALRALRALFLTLAVATAAMPASAAAFRRRLRLPSRRRRRRRHHRPGLLGARPRALRRRRPPRRRLRRRRPEPRRRLPLPAQRRIEHPEHRPGTGRAAGRPPVPRLAAASGATPLDYLASLARPDGSIEYSAGSHPTPVWTTAQALLGLITRGTVQAATAPRGTSGSPCPLGGAVSGTYTLEASNGTPIILD